MERFTIANSKQLLAVSYSRKKESVIDVRLGSKYASGGGS